MASRGWSLLRLLPTGAFWLALGAALPAPAGAQTPPNDELEIHFIDVGQGDAALIRLGHRTVLVDGGRGRDFIRVLEEFGIDSFEAVVASHNHDDHVGGLVAAVSDRPVKQFFGNGRPPTIDNARDLESWLRRKQVPRPAPPWEPVRLGDVTITIVPPPDEMANSSENNNSLGVLVERAAFKALLTGDSEREELSAWLRTLMIPDVDVLKAAHHGARDGVIPGWIARTRPETVVISVGANNSYGHPDPIALRYYGVTAEQILRTDEVGTVSILVDRQGRYRIETSGPVRR